MPDNINIGTVSKVKALDTETGEGIWDAPVANAGFQNLFRLRGMIWLLVNGTRFTAID